MPGVIAQRSLLTAHCSLLTADYSLLTAHCSLLTAHYSLLTTHCSLLTAHCSYAHMLICSYAQFANFVIVVVCVDYCFLRQTHKNHPAGNLLVAPPTPL